MEMIKFKGFGMPSLRSYTTQIVVISAFLQFLVYTQSIPILAIMLLLFLGSFVFTFQASFVSRLLLSFVTVFGSFVSILLFFGVLGLNTLSDQKVATVFISTFSLVITFLAIIRTKQKKVDFVLDFKEQGYLSGFIFLLPFFSLAWFRPYEERNLWAYIGWDRSGQHLAQIIDLNARGAFYYEFPGTLYPRAMHSFLAQFNALTLTPSISPQQRVNQTFEILIWCEWLGAILTLLLLLLIFRQLAIKLKVPAFFQICGSLVIGWIYCSDQFLLVPFLHGWSASIVGAWLCLLAAWGFLEIQTPLYKFMFLSAIGMLTAHTWTLVLPFVGFLQVVVLIQILLSKSQVDRRKLIWVTLTIFAEVLSVLPLALATFNEYANTTAFNAENYVPIFFLPLQIALMICSIVIANRLRLYDKQGSYLYFWAVSLGLASTYLFAVSIDSPLIQLYYYPAKLLWTYLLLLVPICVVSIVYFLRNFLGNLNSKNKVAIGFLLFTLIGTSFYSAKFSWVTFSSKYLIDSTLGNSLVFPAENKMLLQNLEILNRKGSIVIWNADGFDYVHSYWLILSGHPTISPFNANNQNYPQLCQYLMDRKDTLLVGRDREVLLLIGERCKFVGEIQFYDKDLNRLLRL
jgi:hypothetical protein